MRIAIAGFRHDLRLVNLPRTLGRARRGRALRPGLDPEAPRRAGRVPAADRDDRRYHSLQALTLWLKGAPVHAHPGPG